MEIGEIGLHGTNAIELVVTEMKSDIDIVTTRSKDQVGMIVMDLDSIPITMMEFL